MQKINPESTEIIILFNKRNFVIGLLCCLLLFIGEIYLVWFIFIQLEKAQSFEVIYGIILTFGGIFFGYGSFKCLEFLLKKQPALIINSEGIINNISEKNSYLILWETINRVNIVEQKITRLGSAIGHIKHLMISLEEENKTRSQKKAVKNPIVISEKMIKYNLNDLHQILNTYLMLKKNGTQTKV